MPEYAKVVFNCFTEEGKPSFPERSLELKRNGGGSAIVAGQSYGQGSSREHAALCPMYLGVRAVIAKSIERIHKANLINFAIVPLEFADESDYDTINENDVLEISGLLEAIKSSDSVMVKNTTQGTEFNTVLKLADRDRDILLADGLLSYTRNNA